VKKVLIIILTIGCILTSGCAKSKDTPNISEQGSNANNLKPSIQVDLNTNKTDSANNKSNITDAETVDNSFFFRSNVSQLNYKGKFLFNDIVEKDVKLHIKEVANLKYGKLYELTLDSIKDVPHDRLSLGYFYVQKDKIYKIEPNEENLNKLKTSEEVSNDIVIVCQDKEIKDILNKDEPGWHHFIEANGNKRRYHSYNNKVSTGYYESFTWEKNKGLINYRSGYGAERDSIELQLNND
jgi:hypothetical protein